MRKNDLLENALQIPKRNSARTYILKVCKLTNEDPEFSETYATDQIDAWDNNLDALMNCFLSLYTKMSKGRNVEDDIARPSPLLEDYRATKSKLVPLGVKTDQILS